MSYQLVWLPEVLLAAGLKVAEVPGWRTRGRGAMGTVRGVICHHTSGPGPARGNMPSLDVVTYGRPDLDGPLAQLCLGRDGTYYVVAAGRCNHAGAGSWQGVATGNSSFIGIEAENSGTPGDKWPDAQMDAYARGVAAILKHVGAHPVMAAGHKEYAQPQGRKDDPSFSMPQFRDRVSILMADNARSAPIIPAQDDQERPTLRRGQDNDEVRHLQQLLKACEIDIKVDGEFGPRTEAAVRQFQRDHDLVPDGIVGPKTWDVLE